MRKGTRLDRAYSSNSPVYPLTPARSTSFRIGPDRRARWGQVACQTRPPFRSAIFGSLMVTAKSAVGLLGRSDEIRVLGDLVVGVQSARGKALILRGEAGIGKSALIDQLVSSQPGLRTVRAVGVESEMELPFGGLHQLCAPLLDLVPTLPPPQRAALRTVFGLQVGRSPDRLLIGLAALSLLCEAGGRSPLLCVVDDGHWLDRASAQVLAFVGRRLLADPLGLVISTREVDPEFSGLSELVLGGLLAADAMALLRSLPGVPPDIELCARIVSEAHGNPLALLEWRRALTSAETGAASGFPRSGSVAGRLEQAFRHRLARLPLDAQRFALVAAAEPVGNASLVWRAAERLGVGGEAALPAVDAGLIEIGATVRFAHPLVRSAAYWLLSTEERHNAHRALADAMGSGSNPDRRAWHRALGTSAPDEEVAEELDRSASRARSRGDGTAVAAFLERSVILTPDPARRAERALSAAEAKVRAGEFPVALDLLAIAEAGPLGEVDRAQVDLVRAQLAFASNRGKDASPLLLKAAKRLEPVDLAMARTTYLDALLAAIFAGRLASPEADLAVVAQVGAMLPTPDSPSAEDLLLEGLTKSFTKGYGAGLPVLRRALAGVTEGGPANPEHRRVALAYGIAHYIWDDTLADVLGNRCEKIVRDLGAPSEMAIWLSAPIMTAVFEGQLNTAKLLVEEVRALSAATGTSLHTHPMLFYLAVRGDEREATALIDAAVIDANRRGEGFVISCAEWATALLHNGLGHYAEAFAAVRGSQNLREVGYSNWALVELIEAATRCGADQAAEGAYRRLSETTVVTGTEWALGIDSRSRALLAGNNHAERLYSEAIDRLGHTRVRFELARAHLLYGEWLRRQNRRLDARRQLRTAEDMLAAMGANGFADRARRELLATGEKVRKRRVDTTTELTDQEECIARLVADGLTNAEIGAQLFISVRTVEWHLRKTFTKLGIGSRQELRRLIRISGGVIQPAGLRPDH
jgi:DNA-binding CsgD family transcriptional regulator